MTRNKILESACKFFAKNGYEGTSLSEIATEVGIKKPSIYAHFSSKEEIFLTIVDLEIQKMLCFFDRVINEARAKDTETILFSVLYKMLEYPMNNKTSKGFWSIIMFFPPKYFEDIIKVKIDRFNDKVKKALEDTFYKGIKKGEIINQDIDLLIYSYLCLWQGNFGLLLCDNLKSNKLFSLEKLEESWKIYWNAIKK